MSYDESPAAPAPVPGPPPAPPTRQSRPRRAALVVAAIVVLLGSAAVGRAAESTWGSDSGASATATATPFVPAQSHDPWSSGSSSSGSSSSGSSGGSSSGGSSSSGNASIDVDSIANSANPAIVNIQTTLADGEAAGTGMVVAKSGVVLTNNHVIEGAEKIRVEIGVTGKTYTADVVGYDVADDVAVLQLQDASNMKTVSVGDPSGVNVNDPVVAIGNAQGKFGAPTVVSGYVSDTSKTITAGDGGSSSETLRDMIEVQADIQSGDSGGPLLDAAGEVIGINSAAEISGGSQFGFDSGSGSSGGVGYAIPIDRALKIAEQIARGDETNGVYVGSQRALLGVGLQADGSQGSGDFGNRDAGSSGAVVEQAQSGSAADDAGIAAGDTIVGVDGRRVGSADELRTAMESHHPGDKVKVEWVDANGESHSATVQLQAGPPA